MAFINLIDFYIKLSSIYQRKNIADVSFLNYNFVDLDVLTSSIFILKLFIYLFNIDIED